MRRVNLALRLALVCAICLSSFLQEHSRAAASSQAVARGAAVPASAAALLAGYTPAPGCDGSGSEVTKVRLIEDKLDALMCPGTTPGTIDLWLISHATAARLVQIRSSTTHHTVVFQELAVWGPNYWFLALDDYSASPGESLRIDARRFGFNSDEALWATVLDINLVNEMMYVGDTPKPYMSPDEYRNRYGDSAVESMVTIIALKWGMLFAQATNTALALAIKACSSEITADHSDWKSMALAIGGCAQNLASSALGADLLKGLFKNIPYKEVLGVVLDLISSVKIPWALYIMSKDMIDKNLDTYFFVTYTASPGSGPDVPSMCNPCIDNAQRVPDLLDSIGLTAAPNSAVSKLVRVRNTGTSSWNGFKLVFVEGDQMGGASPVSVAPTLPQQEASITLNLKAPATGGVKTGGWQLVNRDGVYVPGGRLSISINVAAPSTPYQSARIASFTADPSSPSNASQVLLRARINWWPGFRAMRVKDGAAVIGEASDTDHTFAWSTAGAAPGAHTLVLEVDDQTGAAWDNPERSTLAYTLEGTPAPVGHAPNRPSPQSPYDWYVYYSGSTAQLCAQANGDPDNDAVTGYYFDIFDSAQLWNSGWTGSACVTTGQLGPYTYQWRAKVRDSSGRESDWSDVRHFSLVDQSLTISEFRFEPQDGSSETVKIRACTSGMGGVNVTMRVSVNDANDGSDSGQWHIIKELGVPCFNDVDAPVWYTLGYGDGVHRVRVEARGNSTGWNGATLQEQIYTLPHRRPDAVQPKAPMSPAQNSQDAVYLNSRTVTFKWQPALRAAGYTLHIATTSEPKDSPTPVYRQTFGANVTEQTLTLPGDYPVLYWQVTAANDGGTTPSVAPRFGVDRTPPTCSVQPLPASTWESVFQVSWSGADALAGVNTYDLQVQDTALGVWQDWMTGVPATKQFDLFTGQPGHSYAFRCRAADAAGNQGAYPAGADTTILVDATSRPPTPWWNGGYAAKRGIILQNNMGARDLPAGYPVKLHFDGTTSPTAAEIYNASQSSPKCSDLRVVQNNALELDRIVWTCAPTGVDIWFKTPMAVPTSGVDGQSLQLYLGNPQAGGAPANALKVWPGADVGDPRAYIAMQDGTGGVAKDLTSWNNNCTFDSSAIQWSADGKFGAWALALPNPPDGGGLACGSSGLAVAAFTAELYVYFQGDGWLMANLSNYSESERWIWSIVGDKPALQVYFGGGGSTVTQRAPLARDKWYHLAVTFDGDRTVRFYQDGDLMYTGTLGQSGIRTPSVPLYIGGAQTNTRVKGKIAFAKLTNGVLASFPHGVFAKITNEPTAALGALVLPPANGKAELALASLNAYPDAETGGILLEAVVANQGSSATGNGFQTDAVFAAQGLAAAAAAPAVRWTSAPVSSTTTITLTALVTPGSAGLQTLAPLQEVVGSLSTAVDASGVVPETSENNNTSSVGVCFAGADANEPDDAVQAAKPLPLSVVQTHNMHKAAEEDWFSVTLTAGASYRLETMNLGVRADTYLYLYGADGTLLSANDDAGSLASQIDFTADTGGSYFVRVRPWDPSVSGCGTSYAIRLVPWQGPDTVCHAGVGVFCADYFNNQTLSGAPSYTSTTAAINYNWGQARPAPGIDAEGFSVRWEGVFNFDGGKYTFTARTDDGMRAWLDGVPVLDAWHDQGATDYQVAVDVAAGQHVVKVEYYDFNFDAVAVFGWSKTGETLCSAPVGKFCAEYFNNQTLAGPPVLSRQEDRIDYDWGNASPAPGVNAEGFSVRWRGKIALETGSYTFVARADDGIRVWLDNKPAIDEWRDQSATQFVATVQAAAGEHDLLVEYYDFNFGAVAQVSWIRNTGSSCTPAKEEFCAEYFSNMSLSGSPAYVGTSKEIAYDWGSGSPAASVPNDNFSARWTGLFTFEPGEYVFLANSDDGIRVRVDAATVIDKWIDQSPTEHQARMLVTGGEHLITVEYYENGWGAVANVKWEKVGEFIAVPRTGLAPLTVDFTKGISNIVAADVQAAVWDFGDGTTSTELNPQHTYVQPGKYDVSMTLDGIQHGQRVGFIEVYAPTTATFSFALDVTGATRTVSFNNESGGAFLAMFWDFGDGTTSTETNPIHTYSGDGPYTVTLTVAGAGGRQSYSRLVVPAAPGPSPKRLYLPLVDR